MFKLISNENGEKAHRKTNCHINKIESNRCEKSTHINQSIFIKNGKKAL